MGKLIFLIISMPLFSKAAFTDSVRINPLGNTVQISGPVSATILNFPSTQIVSGSVSVNNQISGFATETTLSAINTKIPTPTQRTPGYVSTSTTGTVSAGAKMVSFHNAGFLNATVLGTNLSAGDVLTFQAPDQDTLGAINYSGTGTTLRILEVR